jgi:uncharacterized RDD family membrane protein YckC
MTPDKPDDESTDSTGFAAMWSSDGLTRSMAATGPGLPVDLPFLFSGGQQLGPYMIVRPLGKGGMGQVYEAEEIESGRRIAIKILSRGLGDDEERERFLREGQLAASLSHPNAVYVFGTTEVQGFPIIAMELAPGGTLKDRLTGTPLSAVAVVDAILQVIAGLDAAASIGILHRDIKPSNCFVHGDGRTLIGDFGLSVATSRRGGGTRSAGTILGTPGFASPEQLRGEALDVRSDIYSVGATIFYMLAGRAPFDGQSTTSLIERVATEPPPSLTTVRPDLPRRLALVVAKCLAKTPAERYGSYAALAAALRPFSSAQLKAAPIVRRMLAGWIDLYVVAWPAIAVRYAFDLKPLSARYPTDGAIVTFTALAAMVLYYAVFEARFGATPGKAIFGLRVVDAANMPPRFSTATIRALAFGLPVQLITRGVTLLMISYEPEVSTGLVSATTGALCVVALFVTARRSNGYSALHDRATATRVVLKRTDAEARERRERVEASDVLPPAGDTRIGPYVVPAGTTLPVTSAVSIEGYDDRLGRRIWIDVLPPGSPPLGALRRDLGRPGRARWLAGRRTADECWDAYEAVEGAPIQTAAAEPQRWTRVRHWLVDLAHEVASGLDDGSLPALAVQRIWIDRDDRARILDWTDPGSSRPSVDPDAIPPDLGAAQRLLYAVTVGALLGIAADAARDRTPDVPLPLPARKLLLSLRDGAYKTTAALRDAVDAVTAVPAVFPKARRAMQIGVCALFPLVMTVVSVGGLLFSGEGRALLDSSLTLWKVVLAIGAGTLAIETPFALLGALVMAGGFTFHFTGAAVVNRRGERVSRLRALWRAIVTWSLPCAVLLLFNDNESGIAVTRLAVQTVGVGVVVAAAVWTALHPSRSIQDRLAGTWVVPR